MEDFYWFLKLCAGAVLLKSHSGGEFWCRQGAKTWSIAHDGICGYICCTLINVHNEGFFKI